MFEGGSALSDFRAQATAAPPAGHRSAHRGRHRPASCTWWPPTPRSDAADRERFAALLTYGEPFAGAGEGRTSVVVTPRLGTVSPWASKATDIAHNCGLALRRVERVTEYRLKLKPPLLGKAAKC
jgi:phosphoribosylformylglycinamidine synthase